MSRTTLCVLTAAALGVLAVGIMTTRYAVLGGEVKTPAGPSTWKVTLVVRGQSHGDVRIVTLAPLDMGRQHVLKETYNSVQFLPKPPEATRPDRRSVLWTRKPGQGDGPIRGRCEFFVSLEVAHPSASMSRAETGLYAAPHSGEHLDRAARNEADVRLLETKARYLTDGVIGKADMAEVAYHFVAYQIKNDPSIDGPAVVAAECLRNESGDPAAKARLLVALLRHCGIPARLVTGLTLQKGPEQRAHAWVEAWLRDRWVPMDPFHRHFGKVPGTYLVFACHDVPIVRGKNVKDLDYAFLVERAAPGDLDGAPASACKRFFRTTALTTLPPAEQKLVEFLLLLPLAALIICVYRNLIGLISFGTFAPALVGLAFRDTHSLPGFLVFVSILLVGWVMRRVLDHYHLLQVPRIAVMLSLIVVVLVLAVVAANRFDLPATKYFSLFPMIILTGMVERFWTLETEDSTVSSFRTLLYTMVISLTIALVVSVRGLVRQLFCYPEMVLLVIAAQLLIGRYTGYRLLELFRFRDFLTTPRRPLATSPGGGPA
jgi:hypothetical protein